MKGNRFWRVIKIFCRRTCVQNGTSLQFKIK